jgi:hypothetical protein
MKTLLATLLLATLCAVTSYGQTIKTLGFNTTNGQVVYSGTNVLTFLNSVRIEEQGGDGATIESGGGRLAVGGVQIDIVNSNVNLLWPIAFDSEELAAATRTNLGLGATNDVEFNRGTFNSYVEIYEGTNAAVILNPDSPSQFKEGISVLSAVGISFDGTNAPAARVNTMRALAGSTNTNEPFSGSIDIIDGNMDMHNVTISNGIILDWQAP